MKDRTTLLTAFGKWGRDRSIFLVQKIEKSQYSGSILEVEGDVIDGTSDIVKDGFEDASLGIPSNTAD